MKKQDEKRLYRNKLTTLKKFEIVNNMLIQNGWVLNLNTYLEGLKAEALYNSDYDLAARIRKKQLEIKG